MKIVCICDLAIDKDVMAPMKALEKYGAEVVFLEDSQMQTPTAITEVMIKSEQEGAESCPANPDVIEAAKDADILVVHISPVNKAVLNTASKLKYVAVLRSGIENINEAVCREKGIKIINAPGRSAHAVADFTLALMLAEMKNIGRGHKGLMEGQWIKEFRNRSYIHDLRNCTVGVIGAGQIGQKVIDRLKGFDPTIIVHDPFLSHDEITKLGYKPVSLDELLRESDIVSLHLRLSDRTENIIGKRELSLMKKTASFINSARAGLVDENALIEALAEHRIGGAALDVFRQEPLPQDSAFLKLDNVTLTPHVAGTSADTFTNSVEIIYGELEKIL